MFASIYFIVCMFESHGIQASDVTYPPPNQQSINTCFMFPFQGIKLYQWFVNFSANFVTHIARPNKETQKFKLVKLLLFFGFPGKLAIFILVLM